MQLFGKRHMTLDDCFDDALLYEDNCNFGGADVRETGSDSSSHTSRHINSEAIADLVLKKMRQEQRYPSNRGYPRAYVCGICSGNHPTGLCQREGNAHASVWCGATHVENMEHTRPKVAIIVQGLRIYKHSLEMTKGNSKIGKTLG